MGRLPSEFASLSYSHGKSFAEILNAEQRATMTVLQDRQRPVYEVSIANPGAETLGSLFALYMDLTVAVAAAHGVNPFDQPGVEFGKKILPKLLA